MKKTAKRKEMNGSENFRWSADDVKKKLPERLEKIIARNGLTFSGLARSLFCHFVECVEEYGGSLPTIKETAERVTRQSVSELRARESSPTYGQRKKKTKG